MMKIKYIKEFFCFKRNERMVNYSLEVIIGSEKLTEFLRDWGNQKLKIFIDKIVEENFKGKFLFLSSEDLVFKVFEKIKKSSNTLNLLQVVYAI